MTDHEKILHALTIVPQATDADQVPRDAPTGIFFSYKSYWKNYKNFHDRTSCAGYWWVVLMNFLIGLALFILMYKAITGSGANSPNPLGFFGTVFPIIIFVLWPIVNAFPSIALTIRRLHDIGRSWRSYFFAFIPLAGPVIMLFFLTASTKRPPQNKFGYLPQV